MHRMHANIFEANEERSACQSDGGLTSTTGAKRQRGGGVFANGQLEALSPRQQLRELVGRRETRKDGENGQPKQDAEKYAHPQSTPNVRSHFRESAPNVD